MCSAEPFQDYLNSQHWNMFCSGIENSSILPFLNVLIDRTQGFQSPFIATPRSPVCLCKMSYLPRSALLSPFRTVLTHSIELCNWRQLSSLLLGQNWILTCILVHSALLTHRLSRSREKKNVLRLNKASQSRLSCSPVLPCFISFDCKICFV